MALPHWYFKVSDIQKCPVYEWGTHLGEPPVIRSAAWHPTQHGCKNLILDDYPVKYTQKSTTWWMGFHDSLVGPLNEYSGQWLSVAFQAPWSLMYLIPSVMGLCVDGLWEESTKKSVACN